MSSKLLTVTDLADYLGVPEQTIYQWRRKGYGPVGHKMGKHVRFRPSDVDSWIDGLPSVVA
jgi:excisionase family DNA binding protein